MKKYYSSIIGAIAAAIMLCCPMKSAAYTIDEIIGACGGNAVEIYNFAPMSDYWSGVVTEASWYGMSEGITLEKVDDTHMMLKGMSDASINFVFTLADANNNPVADGTRLIIANGTYETSDGPKVWSIRTDDSRGYVYMNIEKNRTTGQFTFTAQVKVVFAYNGQYDNLNTFSNLVIDTYVANGRVTENIPLYKFTYQYKKTSRGFPIYNIDHGSFI